MERTQQAARRLAEHTSEQIRRLWAAHKAGDLTLDQFRTQAAALVAVANTAGVQLADLGVAAEATLQLQRVTPPLGLTPTPVQIDQDRIAADIDRITSRNDDPTGELGDWARSEPLLTVATAVQAAMVAREVAGWTRVLSGGSCPLCVRWGDGVTRPVTVRMARHPGCDCIQQPQF